MPRMLYLTQRDARWATAKIGKTNLTIGNWGCAITAVSMLSSFYGCYKSPLELARVPGLFDAYGRIVWSKLKDVFGGRMVFDWRAYGKDNRRITASINGSPKTSCVMQVNNQRHWVVGTAVNGPGDYWIADPIDGKRKLLKNAYPNVTGSAHFHGA